MEAFPVVEYDAIEPGAPAEPRWVSRVDELEFVLAEARRVFGPAGAEKWLRGIEPRLADRRPAELLRSGRVVDVIRALLEHRAGSYG